MSAPQRLSQYVQPHLPEARIAGQWARLASSSPPPGRFKFRLVPVLAMCLGASLVTLLVVFWHRPVPNSSINGMTADTDVSGIQALTLPDGTRVDLAAASRLVVDEYGASRVRLSLQRGQANLQVTRNLERVFTVLASDYEISVIGTRFSVIVGQLPGTPRVTVHVQQGKVSVRSLSNPHDERVLGEHESWTADSLPEAIATSGAPMESPVQSSHVPAPQTALSPSSPSSTITGMGARSLFESAEQARVDGKLRESAEVFNRLRKTYRSDPRAGLAAFELGRIRMDNLGDVSGGVDALRDAILLSPNASFREDAEARLIQLYHRQGDVARCRSAKQAYRTSFPSGAASKVIEQLCRQ